MFSEGKLRHATRFCQSRHGGAGREAAMSGKDDLGNRIYMNE